VIGLDAVNLNVAGDEATWDEEAGANCTEAKGPPKWHNSLEVDEDLRTPAGDHRHRRSRLEGSPFDHKRRQRRRRRRNEPPKRSSTAPLWQNRPPAARGIKGTTSLASTTSKSERTGSPTTAAKSAKTDLIYGDAGKDHLPRLRLRPMELDRKRMSRRGAPDLAHETWSSTPTQHKAEKHKNWGKTYS
jgi:hypothetical protein